MKHFLIASLFFFLGGLFAQKPRAAKELFPKGVFVDGFDTGVALPDLEFVDPKNIALFTEGFVTSVEDRGDKTLLMTCSDDSKRRCWAVPVSKKLFKPKGNGWALNQWYVFDPKQFPIGSEPKHATNLKNENRVLPAVIWVTEHVRWTDGASFNLVSQPLSAELKKRGYMDLLDLLEEKKRRKRYRK